MPKAPLNFVNGTIGMANGAEAGRKILGMLNNENIYTYEFIQKVS